MSKWHGPYRQTTTISFHGCGNIEALLAPPTSTGMRELERRFNTLMTRAGFKLTKGADGCFKTMSHGFYQPGKLYGYTFTAILAASAASVHTYPEDEYDRLYELELNLCFLWAETLAQHRACIRKCKEDFAEWLKAEYVRDAYSRRRYFVRDSLRAARMKAA